MNRQNVECNEIFAVFEIKVKGGQIYLLFKNYGQKVNANQNAMC